MNLIERAQQWVDHDPDPVTAEELGSLVQAAREGDQDAELELARAMNGPLQFGTAGLRGEIGAGESRMNLAVVIRATAGLCAVLLKHAPRTPRVVIGCDARYGSVDFAHAAARVASAAGCEVLLLPLMNPTPLTAFSVRELDADAGIMVTASHNPPRDNGYKVYLGGTVVTDAGQGVQIVPPFDAEIASAIASAPFADQIAQNDELIVNVDPREDYIARALDLAIANAAAHGSDLIIAVDPDADRCALAVPDSESATGWRQLSGDEIGSLLGEFRAQSAPSDAVFANSIVSSRLLGKIAEGHGLKYQYTLTGFKWIARVPGLYFGYEEAIGFCPDPSRVRDKDGIATSVVAASLFAQLKTQGRSAKDELERLARLYGLHVTAPLTFRVDRLELIAEGMQRLRAQPPTTLASSEVEGVVDLSKGWDGLPGTDALMVTTTAGDRVIARPSGTEPKLKCYLEVIIPVEEGAEVPWEAARARLESIKAEFGAAIGI